MQKLIKHKPTGRVFAWTKELAKRNDMVDYEVPAKKAAEPVAPEVVEQPVEAQDDIKVLARGLLTKKGKANGEASVGEAKSQEAQ